jgi:hypothetical protein
MAYSIRPLSKERQLGARGEGAVSPNPRLKRTADAARLGPKRSAEKSIALTEETLP